MLRLYDSKGNAKELVENSDIIRGNNSVKLPDGTMIVTGSKQYQITSDNTHNGRIEVALDDNFVGHYFPCILNIYSNSNTIIYSTDNGMTSNKFNVYFYSVNPLKSGDSVFFKYIAIGRWK